MIVVANGEEIELDEGATVADLIERMGLARRVAAVEHNGDPVARSQLATRRLADGDRLEMVRAVAGG